MSEATTQDAVERIRAARAEAVNHFNMGRIADLAELFYAPDAVALPGAHEAVRGRPAIAEFLREVRESGDVRFDLTISTIAASGEIGYLVGDYVFTDAAGAAVRGLSHESYRMQPDGRWQCVVDTWHDVETV